MSKFRYVSVFPAECKLTADLLEDPYQLEVELPSYCPCCGRVISEPFEPLISFCSDVPDTDMGSCVIVLSLYFCQSCTMFFSTYNVVKDEPFMEHGAKLLYIVPNDSTTSFSLEINTLSGDFVRIFNQAELAERQGLLDICGGAYRKALECLIRDYILGMDPGIKLEGLSLGQQIQRHIEDEKMNVLASRAVWLGNDHVHTVNKHPECSLEDLKRFILTFVKLIDADIVYRAALKIENIKT